MTKLACVMALVPFALRVKHARWADSELMREASGPCLVGRSTRGAAMLDPFRNRLHQPVGCARYPFASFEVAPLSLVVLLR